MRSALLFDANPPEDLKDLYDNAPCGYVSLRPNGHIAMVNATLLDWLGRDEHELLNHSIHDFLSFGGKIAFETHLAPLLRLQGFVHEIALDLIDAKGEKVPVIANSSERRGPDDEHLFTRMTIFKAVDRRTFERSLLEAKVKAEALAKAEHEAILLREQFIAVLGHDLRNPLAAVDAGIRMLKRDGIEKEFRDRVLHEMNASIIRANGLISDVMDFARGKLGSGLPVHRQKDAQVGDALEQVLTEQRRISPDRIIEADIAIDERVDCDFDRIAQLAANLLANAVAHGAEGVPITLSAKTIADDFELSVANGGDPIPEEARESLFEPFVRADFSGSGKGLGLGLFIVSQIADAHGGDMSVSSKPGETRFTFTMPRLTTD